MWVMQMIMATAVKKNGEEQMVIKGMAIINDLEGCTANHITLFNVSIMKKLITMFETAWPMKPKAEHILNMPSFFESLHSMMQSMQKQKMRDRNHVHKAGDLTALHQDVGTEILPVEYGGSNGTLKELADFWKAEVTANKESLLTMSQYRTDESRRPGKPKTHAELFGIEGSFRKLEID